MKKETFIYRVDNKNIIAGVSENWKSFALGNSWISEHSPERVVGQLLWNFIQGIETRHLYEKVFQIVRDGKFVGPIPFRCDSPQAKRFLELSLLPLPKGQIRITSTIIRSEPRDYLGLIDNQLVRSNKKVKICSMCKRIAIAMNKWVDIEQGLIYLKPFEAENLPKLIHSLCPSCSLMPWLK